MSRPEVETLRPDWHLVSTQLGFTEGPVVLPDGRIACVDEGNGRVVVTDAPGPEATYVETLADLPGAPNGLALGPDGALYVANNGGLRPSENPRRYAAPDLPDGCVQRIDPDGTVTVLTRDLPGALPHRPNDLCFDAAGHLYVTDSGNWEALADGGYRGGAVLRLDADGSAHRLFDVDDFANGIAMTPDGQALVVAHTLSGLLTRHRLSDGRPVAEGEVLADLSSAGFGPDGISYDDSGRLYVASPHSDALAVLDADGALTEVIAAPATGMSPTNVVVDGDWLWVTFGRAGALGRCRLTRP